MKYLLDTNICIYIIKQKPIEVFEKFRSLHVGDVGISAITLSELEYGVQKSRYSKKNKQALQEFLLPLEIYEFDYKSAIVYGTVRAYLEKSGTPIGALDTLIASHALSLGISIITNNEKEFKRVPNLKVENWITGS